MPERYLVVKPVIGNTYAAVSASTYFSDWVQVADKEAPATTQVGAASYLPREDVYIDGSSTQPDGPPPAETPGEAQAICIAAATEHGGAGEGGPPSTFSFFHVPWGIRQGQLPGDDDIFHYGHGLAAGRRATAQAVAVDTDELLWRDEWKGSYPPNAIGYEVEQVELQPELWLPVAEPLAAVLRVDLDVEVLNGKIPGLPVYASLNRQWGTGPVTWEHSTSGGSPHLNFEVQARHSGTIPLAEDASLGLVWGDCGFTEGELLPHPQATFTVDNLDTSPPYTGLLGLHSTAGRVPGGPAPSPTPVYEDNLLLTVGVAATLTPESHYMIRPPRIRWIFPSDPYRRTYPRDDALAGGATRTWPPARSVQSSNRTFGGYL